MTAPRRIRGVLFDLDGTLIDSAPDLAGAANRLLAEHGRPPMPYEKLRPMVGSGARGMVGAAFGVGPDDAAFPALRDRFLALYEAGMHERTVVFDAAWPVLDALDERGLPWGIVTNKHGRFARPVVEYLGLATRSRVLVAGDTTPHAKPHPAPLLAAADALGLPAESFVYVGDDQRDVQAGRAAGMATAVAAWGYLGEGEPAHAWGADVMLETPAALLQWLQTA